MPLTKSTLCTGDCTNKNRLDWIILCWENVTFNCRLAAYDILISIWAKVSQPSRQTTRTDRKWVLSVLESIIYLFVIRTFLAAVSCFGNFLIKTFFCESVKFRGGYHRAKLKGYGPQLIHSNQTSTLKFLPRLAVHSPWHRTTTSETASPQFNCCPLVDNEGSFYRNRSPVMKAVCMNRTTWPEMSSPQRGTESLCKCWQQPPNYEYRCTRPPRPSLVVKCGQWRHNSVTATT